MAIYAEQLQYYHNAIFISEYSLLGAYNNFLLCTTVEQVEPILYFLCDLKYKDSLGCDKHILGNRIMSVVLLSNMLCIFFDPVKNRNQNEQ